jgi:endonuclease/exonuclease/phosphatase family metal-dependent hydrolase
MAKTIRICTFNVENLFSRYKFVDEKFTGVKYEEYVHPIGLASIKNRTGAIKRKEITDVQRKNTALAILEHKPDILCVQEVESMAALRIFNQMYMKNYYAYTMVIDGNDPRGIDVGVMITKELADKVTALRSHCYDATDATKPVLHGTQKNTFLTKNAVFSRDCLEVEMDLQGKPITLLVNHLKAQDRSPQSSGPRRLAQAKRVAQIVQQNQSNGRLPIVLGDLNIDIVQKNYDDSLKPLFQNTPNLYDAIAEKVTAAQDRWTHFQERKDKKGKPSGGTVSRLDYILLDEGLKNNVSAVHINRKGLSTACKQYTGARYKGVAGEGTEASDHCPVVVELLL